MKKAFRLLLAFAVFSSIHGQAADPSEPDGVDAKAPAAPQWKDANTYQETRVHKLLFDALTALHNDKTARENGLSEAIKQHETILAVTLGALQTEIKNEESALAPLKKDLSEKQARFELAKETPGFQKLWFTSSCPEYKAQLAALQALNDQKAKFAGITARNKELSDAALARKESSIKAFIQESAKQRSELVTRTDEALSRQIDDGYLRATEYFRANPQANVVVVTQNPDNPLLALLEEGLFGSAAALTDLNISINEDTTLNPLAEKMLGHEKAKEIMDIYAKDSLESSKVLIEAVAAKQKVSVLKKKPQVSGDGGYRLLNWIWLAKNHPQDPVKDEELERAEAAAQQNARSAFLDGYIKFAVASL